MPRFSPVLRAAAVVAGACLLSASAGAQTLPISASGWNRDIVVEASAVTPYSAFALSFDTFNNIAWFERGLPGSTKGLPPGGSFTSVSNAAIQGQLQPYTAPNALFLDVASPTGSLTFDPVARRPYDSLVVFAASSNGGGTGTMVITFTDNSTSGAISYNAQDWFNVTTNNALNDLGRVSLTDNTLDQRTGNPRIYQTVVDMAGLGLNNRAVLSIAFTKPNVAGNAHNTVIMAVSGQAVIGTTGACTFPDGTCALVPQANCTGTYLGDNTSCPPGGACIATNGDCTVRTAANCTFVGGAFQGANSTCPAAGACIAASGNCTQVNSFQCAFQGGTFLGAGMACPAPGACCSATGCTLVNSFQCTVAGGNFQGAGTVCAFTYPAITVGGGAFEDISATGTEVAWTTGTNDDGYASVPIGFTFPFFSGNFTDAFVGTNGLITFGAGSTAFGNACPAPNTGAPNNAIFPSWDDFHIGTATFAAPGRVYTQTLTSPNRFIVQYNRVGQYNAGQVPTDENTFEAVLFENGNIELRYGAITAQAACDATVGIEDATGATGLNYDNTLLGTGGVSLSIAAMSPCPTTTDGACCCGSHCSVSTAANCTGAGRTFAGSGSACTPFSNSAPCCRGDYNKSGGAPSVQDIFDFLAGYFSTDACADSNDSGTVSVQDIFDFLSAYFGGGC